MDEADEARTEARQFFGPGAREDDVIAGRYRVINEIGAGGMGQVVKVEHLELEKHFALKLIRPDRWDALLEERFRREAKALARVSSPRVAQITDFGVDPDRGPFYVMELCAGDPLDDLIEREGALGSERALSIALGIAKALVDVHEAGIVHRDIKPGNIAVSPGSAIEVRLMDFGLAASIDDRFGSRMTESKRVVGSMPYMAPEQFHGERPTTGMDIWALGIVLYEMSTGQLPFEAPSTAALIHRILNERVPFRGSAPREYGPIFDRLLAKDPALRCPSAEAAVELLELGVDAPRLETPSTETAEATRIETDPPPAMQSDIDTPRVETVETGTTMSLPRTALPPGSRRFLTAALLLGVVLGVGAFLYGQSRSDTVRAVPLEDVEAEIPEIAIPVEVEVQEEGLDLPDGLLVPGSEVVEAPTPEEPTPEEPAAEEPAAQEPTAELQPRAGRAPSRARPRRPQTAPTAPEEPPAPQVQAPPADPEPPAWNGGIIESREP